MPRRGWVEKQAFHKSFRSGTVTWFGLHPEQLKLLIRSLSAASTRMGKLSEPTKPAASRSAESSHMSGHVAVSIVLDRNGEMADDMDISVYGIPEVTNSGEYFDDVLYKAAMGALAGIPKKRRRDEDVVRVSSQKFGSQGSPQ